MGKHTIYKSEAGKKQILQHYEDYLKTFPFVVERDYVDTSFGRTHILVAGPRQGKPLFVFQGGNCINPMTLSWFAPLVENYRIYAPDTIGHPGYSDENRMSGKDCSFAQWIKELMDFYNIERCAFIGPSFGGGIILRLADFMPDIIDCAVLVSPAGIKLGSKLDMIRKILIPMIIYQTTSSKEYLHRVTNHMAAGNMKENDVQIIGDIFKNVKLESEMPKLTEKSELVNYRSPTLIIAGSKDIFFPEKRLKSAAQAIIPNLVGFKSLDMGHFPSTDHLIKISSDIRKFLSVHYK
ncbi:alpha/beta fold hydrolase [Neobacillus dielmonensis]|uniref:alpha/beta fold hydrolase n=1 Tax=Neobacillus dielmonensis TaxID=1347369 RepID=UPI0005A99871|nr:alpha/beta hydrolase [Neobacillus dielmonensis]